MIPEYKLKSAATKVHNETRVFICEQYGLTLEEADGYFKVDYGTQDYRQFIEVRAELTYAWFGELISLLDEIVERFDKFAYFEMVDSGIARCWFE